MGHPAALPDDAPTLFPSSFLFKAKKATTFISPPPVAPTVPRLEEEVVPDDRDDPEIIMNTTTVRRDGRSLSRSGGASSCDSGRRLVS